MHTRAETSHRVSHHGLGLSLHGLLIAQSFPGNDPDTAMSHSVPLDNSDLSAWRRSFEDFAIDNGFTLKCICFGFQVGSVVLSAASPLCLLIALFSVLSNGEPLLTFPDVQAHRTAKASEVITSGYQP